MSEKTFEYLEYVCANTPARQHYMLIQARDTESGEIVLGDWRRSCVRRDPRGFHPQPQRGV